MNINKQLLVNNPYSRPGGKNTPEQIVIHYVGNPGSSAQANRNYFNSLATRKSVYASSQYIVGLKGEIILCIPENEVAYHAAHSYTNSHSIGIECCHPNHDGKFNDHTYVSLVKLCADICNRYKLDPKKDIIRHYDVPNGRKKPCPLYYVRNGSSWTKLLEDINNELKPQPIDENHKANVDIFVKHKIISSPELWYDPRKVTHNHIKALINKIVVNYGYPSKDHVSNVNAMVKLGIIGSPELWYTLENVTTNHIKALINKIAIKLEQ